jgi:hypothetical protein
MYIYECIYVCMDLQMPVMDGIEATRRYIYIYTCIYICLYICMNVHVHVHMNVFMYLCMYESADASYGWDRGHLEVFICIFTIM